MGLIEGSVLAYIAKRRVQISDAYPFGRDKLKAGQHFQPLKYLHYIYNNFSKCGFHEKQNNADFQGYYGEDRKCYYSSCM